MDSLAAMNAPDGGEANPSGHGVHQTPVQSLESMTLAELDEWAVYNALVKTKGNRTHAARALGISSRTILRRIAHYGFYDVGKS